MNAGLAVFGSFTIDDLVFADGTTSWTQPGGSAVYAACGALPWTDEVSIVAPLGEDFPRQTIENHIDLSRCRPVSTTMRNWGLYEEDGERHFISRKASRNWRDFCPAPADAASGTQFAAHIGPMPYDVALPLIEALRKAGTRYISLDLDDHDLTGRHKLDQIVQLVRAVDLFLPSSRDVLALLPVTDPLKALSLLRLLAPATSLIAIKCGAEGVIGHVATEGACVRIPAIPVHVVDTTGAGDAFCGGTLGALTQGASWSEALLCGTVSASICIEAFGFHKLTSSTKALEKERLERLSGRVTSHSLE